MPRQCSVCSHPEAFAINEALVLHRQSNRRIAPQYGLDEKSIRRHREHIPQLLVQASNHEEIYGPKAEAPSPPKEVEERRVRRIPAEELRRAVDSLRALNETRRQEIAHHDEEGAAMPDEEWARDVEARERMLTEDFREQGILDYVRAVNDGREMAPDDVRRLCVWFEREFLLMHSYVDEARLIAGLAAGRTEVEARRFRSQIDAGVPGLAETEGAERRAEIGKLIGFLERWEPRYEADDLDEQAYREFEREEDEIIPWVAWAWEAEIEATREALGREPKLEELHLWPIVDRYQTLHHDVYTRAGERGWPQGATARELPFSTVGA